MRIIKKTGIIILFLLITLSVYTIEQPQLYFSADFHSFPFYYEPLYSLQFVSFHGALSAGIVLGMVTISGEISENLYSFNSISRPDFHYGAWNILRGTINTTINIKDRLTITAGIGGSWYKSGFYYKNSGAYSKSEGGVSLLFHMTFFPPFSYINIMLLNNIDLFITPESISPHYKGGIRVNFHPYLDWINLYVEIAGMPWFYKSEQFSIQSGLFMWSMGISFTPVFPRVIGEMKSIKKHVKQNRLDADSVSENESVDKTDNTVTLITDVQTILSLQQAVIGEKILLSSITFVCGSDMILPESFKELDGLYEVMLKRPDMMIQISGYAIYTGDAVKEFKLCVNRVNKIIDYLVYKGINKKRLKITAGGNIISEKNDSDKGIGIEVTIVKE